jgi:hypothetical protein
LQELAFGYRTDGSVIREHRSCSGSRLEKGEFDTDPAGWDVLKYHIPSRPEYRVSKFPMGGVALASFA